MESSGEGRDKDLVRRGGGMGNNGEERRDGERDREQGEEEGDWKVSKKEEENGLC